jgi:hypothetical protein
MSIMADVVNIEVDQGSSLAIEYDWINPSTQLPMDLTNCTAKMQVRSMPGGADVLLQYSTQAGSISINIPAGTVTVLISPADTTTFTNVTEWRRGVYDLVITNTQTNAVTMLARGEFTILPRVTI